MARLALAVSASMAVFLAAATARAERGAPWEPECVDAKVERAHQLELERLLVPLTAADMCTVDPSQCAPSNPIPPPPDVSPPQSPHALAAGVVPVVRSVETVGPAIDAQGGARRGVTRDLLRPPR